MTFFESFLMRPFTVLYHTFSYIARQKMRKKINGVFTKKAHSVYAKITKRNSNRRRKKYFKTQKSSQNDVVRLYFTFFSHIPLALSVKKCYTYKKIIYNILYNRIVLFRRHSSSADGLCRKANTADPERSDRAVLFAYFLKVLHSVSLQLHAPTPSTFILSDSQTPSTLNIHLSAAQST